MMLFFCVSWLHQAQAAAATAPTPSILVDVSAVPDAYMMVDTEAPSSFMDMVVSPTVAVLTVRPPPPMLFVCLLP